MNKKLQGFIAGISAGVILASSTVLAANTTTWYNVLANGIKIVVDGVTIKPKDANGKTVEPIIYNGTTYLPVRAIADALGKEVYWDGSNYTVYLGDMGGESEYPSIQIEDMVSIAQQPRKSEELTDNYGNNYNRAIYNFGSGCTLEYLLNMKYSKFKGTLYIPQGENSDLSVYFSITADGKTIYTSPKMTKNSKPVDIDVNVTGYNDIKLEYSNNTNSEKLGQYPTLCLGNAGFYQ